MKNIDATMSTLFYMDDRDSDFLNACEQIRRESAYMPSCQIARKAVLRPAQSFYLHPRQYAIIIRNGGRMLPSSPARRELHIEILRLSGELEQAGVLRKNIPALIAEMTAPRFYISAGRAASLYYRLMKMKNRRRR